MSHHDGFNEVVSGYKKKYINHHGEISEGHVIHHVDYDKRNNDINNLIDIPNEVHVAIHNIWSGKVWKMDLDADGNPDPATRRKDVPDRSVIHRMVALWHSDRQQFLARAGISVSGDPIKASGQGWSDVSKW